ncbi:MAG: PD40 domain-containing protein [Opitutaceae bacterium]|nr:PD40 domain-containing protein [Cytophagales bacterium]
MPCKLQAQSTIDHFGKNRIQHKRFDWTYYKTDNFEIYFYREGSEIARFTALHAEEEFKRISKLIGYAPFGKTRILLYNSHTDLLQSNIGLDDEMAFIGGQTNFVKLNAELAFNGNLIDFKNDISVNIAKIYITDLLYGGNIREVYQNSLLMNLPDWFVPGAAAYVGRGWSQEMDDFMRDVVTKYRLRNPAKFRGREAELLGQSIFNYITFKYGEVEMANIISFGRIMRNDKEAIENTLNIKYKDFMKEWKSFYIEMAEKVSEEYNRPEKASRIKKSNYRGVDYNKIKISPDGKRIAYTQNLKGRYTIKITKIKRKAASEEAIVRKVTAPEKVSDIDKEFGVTEDTAVLKTILKDTVVNVQTEEKITFGRKRTLKRGGTNLVNQKVNYNMPLIAWKNNNQLSVLIKKKNRHILKTYKKNGTVKSRIKIYNFNQILDYNWSPDDNFIVLSAERNGQSDIYLYDTRRASTKVITNDMYDDLNPIFQKGTKNLIWSSNRHNDTLGVDEARFRLIGSNLDLFVYNPEVSTSVLQRITHSTSDEIKPVSIDNQSIAYLGDGNGIMNVFKLSLDDTTTTVHQITKNAQSFREFDFNYASQGIAHVSISKGKERVHFEPININSEVNTSKTTRQVYLEKQFEEEEEKVAENRREAIKVVEDKLRTEMESEKLEKLVDAIMNGSMTDSAIAKLAKDTTVNILDLDTVQTETFVFESEKNTLKASSGFYANRQGIKTDKYYLYKSDYQLFAAKGGLWKARHKLGIENTVTSIFFDPLRGMGGVMNLTLADMFNDHRFYGGLFGSTDLRTSNVYLEYQYLKKRIDFKFRYEKQRLYISNQRTSYQPTKYTVNKFEVEVSYPITNTFRVSAVPYYMNSRFNFARPFAGNDPYDQYTNYASYRLEAVYDNTLIVGHNMQEGTKFKIAYDFNYALQKNDSAFVLDKKQNFGKVLLDVRRYQRIHQELILAMRFTGGSFLGPAKKNFLLGGMDNWVTGNSTNTADPSSPLYNTLFLDKRDLLFNKYVTNMRGFSYNQLYGNNHLVLNFEVRWPVIKYFYRGVIGSNFLKNLQLIGFYDVGTAWSGTNPWDQKNNFNTVTIAPEHNPFSAQVINYRNPWLQGFGPGLRTMLLGYYLKVDLAWGVMDYVVKKPVWYVTLGYDF